MPELKLKQIKYESDTWKRSLAFMIDENIHLKNRLAGVLKGEVNKDLVDEAENFQSRFIKEDELISLVRNQVAEFDALLVREIFEDGKIVSKVNRKLQQLRSNIHVAEQQLGKLKFEFNSYLSENI